MAGKIEVPGKDLCDMSGNQAGRTPEQFTLYNVMLPRIYYPALQGNSYERRCKVTLACIICFPKPLFNLGHCLLMHH